MKSFSRNSKKPNKLRAAERVREREDDEMLSEFSDDYNEFYVDEVAEGSRREREERSSRREDPRAARRRPVSPLRRKLTRIISTVVIVGVILIVGVVLSLTVLFKTQSYQVIGNTLYLESDIIKTCGIEKGENIFLAAKGAAEERIVSRFPYVEEARVTFSIPDTIKIEITQAVEGYVFKAGEADYLVISTKGRVLNRITDASGFSLPIFIGPKLKSGEIGDPVVYEDDTILNIIDNITQVFSDNGYQGITEIDATDTANITFTYDARIRVKLGIPEDLSYKIRTAMTIINGNLDVNPAVKPMGVLDVSRCNKTKKSYFNEQDISPTEVSYYEPTEAPTEEEEWYDWDDEDW